jgi:hypothetical protein
VRSGEGGGSLGGGLLSFTEIGRLAVFGKSLDFIKNRLLGTTEFLGNLVLRPARQPQVENALVPCLLGVLIRAPA